MRLAIACLLLLACAACAAPGPTTVPLNSDVYNASAATNGEVVVVTAPACSTAYVSGGCMKDRPDSESVGAQRWSYARSVVNGNATRCTFTFALPAGETALAWFLVATSNCAN